MNWCEAVKLGSPSNTYKQKVEFLEPTLFKIRIIKHFI